MSSPLHVCVILTWQFRQTYYTCKVRVRWWIDIPFGIRVSHDGILVWPWKTQVCWRKQHMMLLLPKVVIWLWPDKTLPKTKRIIEHRKTKNKKEHDLPTTSQPPVFSASKLFSLIGVTIFHLLCRLGGITLETSKFHGFIGGTWKSSTSAVVRWIGSGCRSLLGTPMATWERRMGSCFCLKMWWCCFFGKGAFFRVK